MVKQFYTKEEKKERKKLKELMRKFKRMQRNQKLRRELLSRELEYAKVNKAKIEKFWMELLQDNQIKEMEINYNLMTNNLDRVLHAKDLQISLLLDELDEAEEQYKRNFQNSYINFEMIIGSLERSLDDMKEQFNRDITQLMETRKMELKYLTESNDENESYLKTMIYGLKKTGKTWSNYMKCKYLSLLETTNEQNLSETNAMREKLENKYAISWKAYKDVITDYKQKNENTRKKFEIINNQDNFMRNWIKQQNKQLWRAREKTNQLKLEQNQAKETIDSKLKAKTDEHNFFLTSFHTLKVQLQKDVQHDKNQLKTLIAYCNNSLNNLKSIEVKGGYILKLNAICRKYETEKELIMPFPEYVPQFTLPPKITNQTKIYKEKKVMDYFWKRCGQGNALRHYLNEEFQYLQVENSVLKQQVTNRCSANAYATCALKINACKLYNSS